MLVYIESCTGKRKHPVSTGLRSLVRPPNILTEYAESDGISSNRGFRVLRTMQAGRWAVSALWARRGAASAFSAPVRAAGSAFLGRRHFHYGDEDPTVGERWRWKRVKKQPKKSKSNALREQYLKMHPPSKKTESGSSQADPAPQVLPTVKKIADSRSALFKWKPPFKRPRQKYLVGEPRRPDPGCSKHSMRISAPRDGPPPQPPSSSAASSDPRRSSAASPKPRYRSLRDLKP